MSSGGPLVPSYAESAAAAAAAAAASSLPSRRCLRLGESCSCARDFSEDDLALLRRWAGGAMKQKKTRPPALMSSFSIGWVPAWGAALCAALSLASSKRMTSELTVAQRRDQSSWPGPAGVYLRVHVGGVRGGRWMAWWREDIMRTGHTVQR